VKERNFALAAKPDGSWVNAGDAARGEKIFFDPNAPLGGICATWHAIKGKGGQVGPDLSASPVNYKRPNLVTSILEPSGTIALGFEQFLIRTKGGDTFAGAIRQETSDELTILGADAKPHVVKKSGVRAKTAIPMSIMPPGLTLSLKAEQFLDLLTYLEAFRGK
jgi:putative heme-binding domain-containing protein